MAIYLSIISIPIFFIIKLLKLIPYFSDPEEWTILKEILAIVIVLLAMGIVLYFMGFLMEVPADRWNLGTFLDSCGHAFLVGIVPFLFFTAINYRHLFATELVRNFNPYPLSSISQEPESLIKIASRLKKEDLSIDPDQFVYAESEGNYVVFYLKVNDQIQRKIIRNSINSIAEQLSVVPYFIRTHRGFIVNVKQVVSQKGNTLGYRLKINGVDEIIPVSRQNTREFDQLLKQYS
jgi:DNA-binding LytR/AlgR family response regulator